MALQKHVSLFFILTALLFAGFSCKKNEFKPRLEPEELQLAEKASQLFEQSEQLSYEIPESLKSDYDPYLKAADKFNYAAQRFGPSSLRGRDAFDKLFYQASQFEPKIRAANLPDLLTKWETLQTEHINKIGHTLGYKLKPEN